MIEIIDQPQQEIITLDEMKSHLRVDDCIDDKLITSMILAARQTCEKECGRAFIKQRLKQFSPACFPVNFAVNKVIEIISVTIVSHDDVETILDPGDYRICKNNLVNKLVLKSGIYSALPLARDVEIIYDAGYGENPSDVPEPLRKWVMLHITTQYENRDSHQPFELKKMPIFDALIEPYVIHPGF